MSANGMRQDKESLYQLVFSMDTLLSAWDTVKAKGASGGIDGISIKEFQEDMEANLLAISNDLAKECYIPQPYREMRIPKNAGGTRALGLPTVRDKVVQQAVRSVIEPLLDARFLGVSYGYRKSKGPVRAIGRVYHLHVHEKRGWLTKCDIEKYFDNIDHEILFRMLGEWIPDNRLCRLVRNFIEMGRVDGSMKWTDSARGVPQGGVISPLLSNLYLHPLDEAMVSGGYGYVRYADDFLVLSATGSEAYSALQTAKEVIYDRLRLSLNSEKSGVRSADQGFEYLGVAFHGKERGFSPEKLNSLKSKIRDAVAVADARGCIDSAVRTMEGIRRFYGQVVDPPWLEQLDDWLINCLKAEFKDLDGNWVPPRNRHDEATLREALEGIPFLSAKSRIGRPGIIREILSSLRGIAGASVEREPPEDRRKPDTPDCHPSDPVRKRKREYRKMEAAGMELIVSTPGVSVGKTRKGVTVRCNGKNIREVHDQNLRHIFVITDGVAISSNLVRYCAERNIPLDFLEFNGVPYARLAAPAPSDSDLQLAQLKALENGAGMRLAKGFVSGKVRNQLNLSKYYRKYHKKRSAGISSAIDAEIMQMRTTMAELKGLETLDPEVLRGKLFSIEGRTAAHYWNVLRNVLSNSVSFEGRERKGAGDLVNSMLNYGYGVLYAKVWAAISKSGLSPFISFLHKPQPSKPTLVYDMVEEFRAQAVDRPVVALLNHGFRASMEGRVLSAETRRRLAEEILGRIDSVEVFRSREMRFGDIIQHQVAAAADLLMGKSRTYMPYLGKW